MHTLSHPGYRPSVRLVATRYFWPTLKTDVQNLVRHCEECQRNKIQRHIKSKIGQYPLPTHRFTALNMDIVGPFPNVDGYTHLLTIIDRFTRFPMAIPLKSTDALEVAKAFINNWLPLFGVPSYISMDRGANFQSQLFQNMALLLGIKTFKTTSYNPKGNGAIERFHRGLKVALRTHLKDKSWLQALPLVMLGLRNSLKTDLGVSSAEMVFGEPLSLPQDLISQPPHATANSEIPFIKNLQQKMASLRPTQTRYTDGQKVYIPQDLATATHVFVRCPPISTSLTPPYRGPFKIISRHDKYITIERGKKSDTVCIDRVKPAYLANDSYFMPSPNLQPGDGECNTSVDSASSTDDQQPGVDPVGIDNQTSALQSPLPSAIPSNPPIRPSTSSLQVTQKLNSDALNSSNKVSKYGRVRKLKFANYKNISQIKYVPRVKLDFYPDPVY